MTKPFKVFGIGLNKTGTSTLKQALVHLGYRHFPHSARFTRCIETADWRTIDAVADAHESFEDWPWPLIWRRLFDRYGDRARYILTSRRDPEAWVESLKGHAERMKPGGYIRRLAYGHDYPHGHESEHMEIYARHNEEIRDFFTHPARLHLFADLCWEKGDGWPELCGFLGEAVPDLPFPHANAATDQPRNPLNVVRNRLRIAQQARRTGT